MTNCPPQEFDRLGWYTIVLSTLLSTNSSYRYRNEVTGRSSFPKPPAICQTFKSDIVRVAQTVTYLQPAPVSLHYVKAWYIEVNWAQVNILEHHECWWTHDWTILKPPMTKQFCGIRQYLPIISWMQQVGRTIKTGNTLVPRPPSAITGERFEPGSKIRTCCRTVCPGGLEDCQSLL